MNGNSPRAKFFMPWKIPGEKESFASSSTERRLKLEVEVMSKHYLMFETREG